MRRPIPRARLLRWRVGEAHHPDAAPPGAPPRRHFCIAAAAQCSPPPTNVQTTTWEQAGSGTRLGSARMHLGIGAARYRPLLEEHGSIGLLLHRRTERHGMKTFVATICAAGMSLTMLSSAQAITIPAASLERAAKQISSAVEVQANRAGGCERGYMMTSRGCREVTWNYKRSVRKKTKPHAQK